MVANPSRGDFPNPGIEPMSPTLAAVFTTDPPGRPINVNPSLPVYPCPAKQYQTKEDKGGLPEKVMLMKDYQLSLADTWKKSGSCRGIRKYKLPEVAVEVVEDTRLSGGRGAGDGLM